jgi:hypothetical protein
MGSFFTCHIDHHLKRSILLWFILTLCPLAGLRANQQDTIPVFYEDRTFNGFLDKAIWYQHKADSFYALSFEWRKELHWMYDPAMRSALQKRIMEAEDSIGIYREMARIHFSYMNSRLPEEKKLHPYLTKDTVLDGITVYQYRLTDEFLTRLNEASGSISDPSGSGPAPSGTEANFRIYPQSPYSEARIFEYDFSLPAGVFYRIQLAVYKTRLAPDHFKGLSPITTEKIPDKNLIRFFVGKFYHLDDARTALEKVRAYGHNDAFIVGYFNGTKGSLKKLQELERYP